MGKIANGEPQTSPDNIDQIRDIIFGAQKREYDTRFQKIENAIDALRQLTVSQMKDLKETVLSQISDTMREVEKRVTLSGRTAQEEATTIRNFSEQVEKKLTADLFTLTQEIAKKVASMRKEVSDGRDTVEHEIRSLGDQIYQELDGRVNSLQDTTVSRDQLSEILVELGMKVKGVTVPTELQKEARGRSNR